MGGRERAIEALIDRDPQGSLYRAHRVLDDAVPTALGNRPNLVTKEALVDQAFSLSRYAIDSLEKFDLAFPKPDRETSKKEKESFDGVTRERIFLFQAKIEGMSEKQASPPENLVAGLRKLYEEKIRQLLEAVTDHAVLRGNSSPGNPKNLEKLIGAVVKLSTDPKEAKNPHSRLQGLVIAILSLLPTKNENVNDGADEKIAAQPENTIPSDLQVGALLALLDPENELLAYFGKAAAIHEERTEIQKARMLARLEAPMAASALVDCESATPPEAGDTPPPLATAECSPPVADADASCESASIDSTASQDQPDVVDDNEDEDDDDDDEDDEALDDSDYSDDDEDDDVEVVLEPHASGDVIDTDDEDAEAEGLQRALAVSMTRSTTPPVTPTATPEEPEPPEGNGDNTDDDDDDDDESSLPPLPDPPTTLNLDDFGSDSTTSLTQAEDTAVSDLQPLLDPCQLSEFGRVPKYLVLRLLLLSAETIVEKMRFVSYNPEVVHEVVPGGMGSFLFKKESVEKRAQEHESSIELSLQLLVATFLLVEERRDDAIKSLRKALSQELHMGQSDDNMSKDGDASDAGSTPLPTSGEADDPALTLAMNYIEDDVPLSTESLENKGMRRKAAAAAHELSVMVETFRKHTESCRKELRNLSRSLLSITKTFRHFLESITRDNVSGWKEFRVNDFQLPSSITGKLASALDRLTSLPLATSELEASYAQELMSVEIYKDSLGLWRECIPILNPATPGLIDLLQSSILTYSSVEKKNVTKEITEFNKLNSFPVSLMEELTYRLRFLCDRFRTTDILNRLVPKPVLYNGENDELENNDEDVGLPLSQLIATVKNAASHHLAVRESFQGLYLALCHRCNTRILLLDGFYAATETESGRSGPSNLKTLATGDSLRVSSRPSKALQFDSTKCSDSIALISGLGESAGALPGNSSVHQRASKVWGAALATNHFSPRTGVHRWAVRLDKCERGHVFLGVATSQASTRTYVGGDRYGWGLIGTQALWHDRRKIRGDYGSPFKTGSTIIVTLDTDAGTLRFSSWRDSSTSSSFSLDPVSQGLFSPKKTGHLAGVVEDWGIAFEGLPLDSKLFPAVGLYQRDDRLTILSVENPLQSSGWGNLGGSRYYPLSSFTPSDKTEEVSQANKTLTWSGIQYAAEVLSATRKKLHEDNCGIEDVAVFRSLSASLCLLPPSVPVLSNRAAFVLMPHLTRSVLQHQRSTPDNYLSLFQEGKWTIRATGSPSSVDREEYVVDFKTQQGGKGDLEISGDGVGTTGKSKCGAVSILGFVNGLVFTFTERWTDPKENSKVPDDLSSCVVSARMSLDGTRFDGFYRNVREGSSGQIVGIRCPAVKQNDAGKHSESSSIDLDGCRHLLCLAQSHLATILAEDASGDFRKPLSREEMTIERSLEVTSVLERPTLALLCSRQSVGALSDEMDEVKSALCLMGDSESGIPTDHMLAQPSKILATSLDDLSASSDDATQYVAVHDNEIAPKSGGFGSFRALNTAVYDKTRLEIVSAFLYLCRRVGCLSSLEEHPDLSMIWMSALKLLEDGIRKSAALHLDCSRRDSLANTCTLYSKVAQFLLALKSPNLPSDSKVPVRSVLDDVQLLFLKVESEGDLSLIVEAMSIRTRRGILRLASVMETESLISKLGSLDVSLVESALVGIPRILGRRLMESGEAPRRAGRGGRLGVVGGCMTGLSGASNVVKDAIRGSVFNLAGTVGRLIRNVVESRENEDLSGAGETQHDSLILIALSVSIGRVDSADFDKFVYESGLLKILPRIFALYRNSLMQAEFEGDEFSVLRNLCKRDISRSILRCGQAVAHILQYHLLTGKGSPSHFDCLPTAIDLVQAELSTLVALVENSSDATKLATRRKKLEEDMETWIDCAVPVTPHAKRTKPKASSSLAYFTKFGTLPASMSMGNTTKKDLGKGQVISFAHQFLNSWIHIISLILDSGRSLEHIVKSQIWFNLFFNAVGLVGMGEKNAGDRKQSDHLPARFRSRILRLMYPFLANRSPDCLTIRGLLELAGSVLSTGTLPIDHEETAVSREAVSLLRKLHSPSYPEWRAEINETIRVEIEAQGDQCKIYGILSFFSGHLSPLDLGSFVLIKPSEASALSGDQNLSGKGNPGGLSGNSSTGPSFGAIPHHVVGSATEPLVAGLTKDGANGGIVSSIDLKNAMCEVILIERNSGDDQEPNERARGGPKPITVRAIRTHLAETVQAEEVPLYLDTTLPIEEFFTKILEKYLDIFLPDHNKGTEAKLVSSRDSTTVAPGLLALRSSIIFLSDESLVKMWRSKDFFQKILRKVLALASPEKSKNTYFADAIASLSERGLSNLPCHEARLGHLFAVLRELSARGLSFVDIPSDLQEKVFSSIKSRRSNMSKDDVEETEPVNSGPETSGQGDSIETGRSVSQSTGGSNSEDEDDNGAAATAAAHLREAAIAQMAELGLPRSWSEFALRRTGGVNIEAAVAYCLERGPEIERLLAEEHETAQRDVSGSSSRRRANRDSRQSSQLLKQLLEMGFPRRWCTEALAVTGNNVDEALTWILNNGERLSEEDEAIESGEAETGNDEGDESAQDEEEEETELGESTSDNDTDAAGELSDKSSNEKEKLLDTPGTDAPNTEITGWTGSVVPLRFISGRAIVDTVKMEVSGLPSGGFSSVGTKGVLLTSGKWYYEAVLETAGCLQIGWADGSFAGHCHADRGDGCGDGPSSWAFDGWRRYRWHATATEWGCRWMEGDVVGCMVDMDERKVSFTLNGEGESIGMGPAFAGEGFRPCGGVYACVSFNRREKLRLILGGACSEKFKYQPDGYRGVGEAILESVVELQNLLECESDLRSEERGNTAGTPKKFLCDFSDGEHGHELMAWTHRYYGSDASVQLGSGRHKQNSTKIPSNLSSSDLAPSACVTRHLRNEWSGATFDVNDDTQIDIQTVLERMKAGQESVHEKLAKHALTETFTLAVLLARKLILHLIIAEGSSFDPSVFAMGRDEMQESLKLWKCIEGTTSLRSAGWVGEAGAMALAAEALGLGISASENSQLRGIGERHGIALATDFEDDLVLPACGASQVLTTILLPTPDVSFVTTSATTCAYAEGVVCSDGGGGILSFLKYGLQSAIQRSMIFRRILVAFVRCSVRVVSEVEYVGEDFDPSNEGVPDGTSKSGNISEAKTEERPLSIPDARLAAFISGLLLSRSDCLSISAPDLLKERSALFEAWSVGLLSASLPWRMVCMLTSAGILKLNPAALGFSVKAFPTLLKYYGRLRSTTARRLWAERAALPVVSRYAQALVELASVVGRSIPSNTLPGEFHAMWERLDVDAATPLPIVQIDTPTHWESDEGWVSGDTGWDVWMGTVDHLSLDWKVPPTSSVHRLMDGGEGPPMLRSGSIVMRGVDWDQTIYGYDDGKDKYDSEKAQREKEKESQKKETSKDNELTAVASKSNEDRTDEGSVNVDPADDSVVAVEPEAAKQVAPQPDAAKSSADATEESAKKKNRRVPGPKLPIGKVVSIVDWDGAPGMGRRVRWNRTGAEGVYRFGGGGGKFDLCHVEVSSRQTKVKKRHPLPESSEQCAARHGFGVQKSFKVVLRIRSSSKEQRGQNGEIEFLHEGVLEWPDFGAGVGVSCIRRADGSIRIEEERLLYGSKDSGWEARFGQPVFLPGTSVELGKTKKTCDFLSPTWHLFESISGEYTHAVRRLRNPRDGKEVIIRSRMTLKRARWCPDNSIQDPLPPITFDRAFHGSSLSISLDGRTVSCASSDGRATAFGAVGFTKGVHYWEVKIEQTTDIGNVFIGVSEKPQGSGSGSSFRFDPSPKLNRWHGWGFVNFRATYASGAERVYGSHCHSGDTVGVLLDCDAGRISFFFDGLKFGEHVLNDLGCAFENLSPFGFNVDGCGSGGAGQGSPSGFESGSATRYQSQGATRPRTLWPIVGLKNKGDRVTFSSKWTTTLGVDGATSLRNVCSFGAVVDNYVKNSNSEKQIPDWFMKESHQEHQRWSEQRLMRSSTRGSGPLQMVSLGGLDVDFDTLPLSCACASASLGLGYALLAGDRVKLTRSAGRILELDEEAAVLGSFRGRMYYRIVSQKSEGGSLTEGGGRAWCWDESEVVGGLPFILPSRGREVKLPMLSRFVSLRGLKIIYKQGAVLRSDLEILENSWIGTIEVGTIIPKENVLERRVNSCGVVRFRVIDKDLGEGWISARIRGGNEEPIVELVQLDDGAEPCETPAHYDNPIDCAQAWYKSWSALANEPQHPKPTTEDAFRRMVSKSKIEGASWLESDAMLVEAVNVVSKFSHNGDSIECSFDQIASAFSFTLGLRSMESDPDTDNSVAMKQGVASVFAKFSNLPTLEILLARVSFLRAFNRRARLALPWISMRPCQEGSALFGGLVGHGASPDRTGRSAFSLANDWIQVPSLSSEVRSLRGLLFTSVKRGMLQAVVEATTTPTLLSHDEFDLPREIRTVRVNRLRAARVMSGKDNNAKRKYSVLSQLYSETKAWGGATLRRGYVAKGHGGQKRAFKVKFVGEGVNDYSGPYREAFTDAMSEVLKTDELGRGVLGVLDRTPNNAASIGEDRDFFMFSQNYRVLEHSSDDKALSPTVKSIKKSFSALLLKKDEASREVEESLVFLGRLVGTAFRHGIAVDLPLPLATVWKTLAEESVTSHEKLGELDTLAARHYEDDTLEAPISVWQKRMLNSFAEGLSHVLPVEVLCLLSGEELRDAVCGNPVVDVGLLKEVAEYEGFQSDDEVIGFFWQTLEEMTNDERKKFLQFVWARNRLPLRESDFDAPFKIVKDTKNAKFADDALPSASTCFFSLSLPAYSNQEALRSKLMFAISNVATMETDFQTNNAEIAEGYRDI